MYFKMFLKSLGKKPNYLIFNKMHLKLVCQIQIVHTFIKNNKQNNHQNACFLILFNSFEL